jgi:hypothetical protein
MILQEYFPCCLLMEVSECLKIGSFMHSHPILSKSTVSQGNI